MIFCAVVGNVCYDPAGARRWPLRGFSKELITVRMLSTDFVHPLSVNDSVSKNLRAVRLQMEHRSLMIRTADSRHFASGRV